MKFRALISDAAGMRDFMTTILSISKFSKECIMRITSRKLYFIISEENSGPRRPLVWCELPVNYYFKEYNLVGISEQHNEIYLEFSTALLARSVSLLKQNVKYFKIKLTNKDIPCLTLEIELLTDEISSKVVHDIPVDIIPRKSWGDYEEPRFNDFHVTIEMPNLKSLRNITERLRNINQSLTVSATKSGQLTFQIKTNIVKVSAHFADLSIQSFAVGQNGDQDQSNENLIYSTIDIKQFLMFVSGLQLNNCRTFCSIVHEKMVKLYMEQPGALSIQIFLTELSI